MSECCVNEGVGMSRVPERCPAAVMLLDIKKKFFLAV